MPGPRHFTLALSIAMAIGAVWSLLAAGDAPPPNPLPTPPTADQPHSPTDSPTLSDEELRHLPQSPWNTSVVAVSASVHYDLFTLTRFTDLRLEGAQVPRPEHHDQTSGGFRIEFLHYQHPDDNDKQQQQQADAEAAAAEDENLTGLQREMIQESRNWRALAREHKSPDPMFRWGVQGQWVQNRNTTLGKSQLTWMTLFGELLDAESFTNLRFRQQFFTFGFILAVDSFEYRSSQQTRNRVGYRLGYVLHADNHWQIPLSKSAQPQVLRFNYSGLLKIGDGILNGDKNYLVCEGELELSLGLYHPAMPFGPWLKIGLTSGFRDVQSSRPHALFIRSYWALQPSATLSLYF